MRKLKILTDTTSYITREYAKKNNIDILPIFMNIDSVEYEESFADENSESYNAFFNAKSIPTTSQPSSHLIESYFEKYLNDGYEILGIFVSDKTSGTYSNASHIASKLKSNKIKIIDSETSGPNLRRLVERSVDLFNMGNSLEEIEDTINKEKKNMIVMMMFENLDHLKKAGRVSNSKALIGNILNIKPIISVEDGFIQVANKVRGKKNAMLYMLESIPEKTKQITICSIFNPEDANKFLEMIKSKLPNIPIFIDPLGPSLGIQFGPKTIGICCYW